MTKNNTKNITTVTIDKFGRILIPKAIRESLKINSGNKVFLSVFEQSDSIEMRFQIESDYDIVENKYGWPVMKPKQPVEIPLSFSIPDFLNEAREERADQTVFSHG